MWNIPEEFFYRIFDLLTIVQEYFLMICHVSPYQTVSSFWIVLSCCCSHYGRGKIIILIFVSILDKIIHILILTTFFIEFVSGNYKQLDFFF